MGYSGAGGKLIHEKNQKQTISRHCPFNLGGDKTECRHYTEACSSKGWGCVWSHLPPEISSIFQMIRRHIFNDDISVYRLFSSSATSFMTSSKHALISLKSRPLRSALFLTLLFLHAIDDDEEIYNRLSYNIHMPENEDYFLDIPPHMRSLKVYSASLGHKVTENSVLKLCKLDIFMYRRPILCTLYGAVDFLNVLKKDCWGGEGCVCYWYIMKYCTLCTYR